LGRFAIDAGDEQHVAGGAIEQLSEYFGGFRRAIVAEDALLSDAAGDVDSSEPRDLTKNGVEA
jgi:hypothetical protein